MLSDIEIAQRAELKPIREIAERLAFRQKMWKIMDSTKQRFP